MSLKHRINKLEQEQEQEQGFRVTCPVLLDASDQKFTKCPDKARLQRLYSNTTVKKLGLNAKAERHITLFRAEPPTR